MFLTVIKTNKGKRTEMSLLIVFSTPKTNLQRNIMSQIIFWRSHAELTLIKLMLQNYLLLEDLPRLESRFFSSALKKLSSFVQATGVKKKARNKSETQDKAPIGLEMKKSQISMPLKTTLYFP